MADVERMAPAPAAASTLAVAKQRKTSQLPLHTGWTLDLVRLAKAKQGARIPISVRARIEAGWHLYAEEQEERGPEALRMWLPENQPFTLSGPIKSPRPFLALDPTFGLRVRDY